MMSPRQNVMYSAMPSSRPTDWNVSAKQVAMSALPSSSKVVVVVDAVRLPLSLPLLDDFDAATAASASAFLIAVIALSRCAIAHAGVPVYQVRGREAEDRVHEVLVLWMRPPRAINSQLASRHHHFPTATPIASRKGEVSRARAGRGTRERKRGEKGATYVLREAGNLMRPYALVAQGVAGQTSGKKVLEEAHVLEAEDGDLMPRLYTRTRC